MNIDSALFWLCLLEPLLPSLCLNTSIYEMGAIIVLRVKATPMDNAKYEYQCLAHSKSPSMLASFEHIQKEKRVVERSEVALKWYDNTEVAERSRF